MPTDTQKTRTGNAAGNLRNGGRPRALTAEDRAKGGRTKAERARQLQDEAKRLMVEQLAAEMSKATRAVLDALEADTLLLLKDGDGLELPDHRTRLSAADRVFDRVAGKPVQGVEHSGPGGQPMVVEHRERLSLRDTLERVAGRRGMDVTTVQASNTRNSPDGLAQPGRSPAGHES